MVFKPFKPPLIRKPSQPAESTPTNENETTRPGKRPRLSESGAEVDNGEKRESGTERPLDNSVGIKLGPSRGPLTQIKNGPPGQTVGDSGSDASRSRGNGGDDVEAYYNVLWRKFTAKKHKTWDGDGILAIRGGYGYLRDISGREMGRIMINRLLEPGENLSIGGKEVEVESEMSKEEYLSGRNLLGGAKKLNSSSPERLTNKRQDSNKSPSVFRPPTVLNAAQRPSGRTSSACDKPQSAKLSASVPTTAAVNKSFKSPLQNINSVTTTNPSANPVPRHDPNAPGALVMKRPSSVPKGKSVVDVVVDPILAKHLREHQREGVKFLYECVMGMRDFNGQGAILADEMGLGKTLQTITLLWTLLKQNPIYEDPPVVKKALIVCPVTLINNWRKEFRKWLGNERIGVFVFDDKRKRISDFTRGRAYHVMIVGYEKLRNVQESLSQGPGVDIVIADEGHRLKTLQNKSGQAIQALNTPRRIILSGTPIQNDLSEFFAAVDLVNPGVLGTYKSFMREFEGPIVRSRQPEATRKEIEKGEARNEELRNLTSMFMLRRTADILSKYLPPKTEYVLLCNPTSVQATIYRHVLASPVFQTALGNTEGAFHLITILKKLCNSPSLLNPKTGDEPQNSTVTALLSTIPQNLLRYFAPSSSGKIRVLDQLLHNLRTTTTEKVVLVSNYTSTLDLLSTLLTSLGLPFLRLDGSTPSGKRQQLVDEFNRSPASMCFAFLLSAKAGGTGLNLVGASRLILFDVDWNPATDMQAMARIHRDGQKRHCRIYRIMMKGGLEEKIWQRQVTKIGLADSVMEGDKGGANVAQFSREELKDIFRLYDGDGCQTHELLNCKCGGQGTPPAEVTASDAVRPDSSSTDEDESDEDDEDSDSPSLPPLIKASELKRSQIMVDPSPINNKSKSKKKDHARMQRYLAQFRHIDPAVIAADGSPSENILDDPILEALLKEPDHGVGYIFAKTGFTSSGSGALPRLGII